MDRKAKILLVDDSADMRSYVQRLLSETYQVHAVGDGEAALAAVQENPPDLVLADVVMPRLDGFRLLHALRDDPRTRSIPVILFSGRSDEESQAEGLEAGADDYLLKPFSPRELLARVRTRLQVSRVTRTAVEKEHDLRRSTEVEESRSKEKLAAELTAMTRLYDLSSRLLTTTELGPVLEEILDATMGLLNADFGNVQLYDAQSQALKTVAQRGFKENFLDYFDSLQEGTALLRKERVIVEDVLTDPNFAPHLEIASAAGFRAVQFTPLFSRSGEPLGQISTHFRKAHRPPERELRFVDLYARQAADIIERKQAEDARRASEDITERKRPDEAPGFGTDPDIEERRQAEEGLQKLQMELMHMMHLTTVEELAASIAREINQPLGAIVNNSNVCLRLVAAGTDNQERVRASLSDIVNDANRLSAIIAHIRTLTKRTIAEKIPLQIKDVVMDVAALAQRELAEGRITVRIELPEDLPGVSGDRVQLQQVLINLVTNASEAMSMIADERRIVTIRGRRYELAGHSAVLITVQDFGSGFRPKDSERLFDAFFTTKPGGMGMGLRTSRSIVEAHGGRLWATSNEGQGATFYFALPISD